LYQCPSLVQALARDRLAELQRTGRPGARRNGPRQAVIATARNRTGWLLVAIGLRLAVPRGPTNGPLQRRRRSASA
jgi:hypothetical protein